MNKMKEIRVGKVTLNVGAGKSTEALDKGLKLLKNLTGIAPVKTFTSKRIPSWGLRPGLPIGCKLTLRRDKAKDILVRMLKAKNNMLKESQFDNEGNVAFGIHEYIDIPGAKYDPEIGVTGLEICITLERPGFRIKRRRIMRSNIPKKHRIMKAEAVEFMEKAFGIKVEK